MNETNRSAGTKRDEHRYDDLVDLPHHVSATHPHMPLRDRAAQFSPFAALVGYDAAVKETARQTHTRIELDESTECIGAVRKIDENAHLIIMMDGVKIPINDVISIQGDMFRSMELI